MNRLKALRKSRGISQRQLAEEIKAAQNTISNWENGTRDMDSATLLMLADYFNVTADFLLGNDTPTKRKGIKIPVLGSVQAGIPIEAIEDILDYEEITPEMAAMGEHFALIIRGDSMEPKISDGDVVIVRKQSDVTSGDTAVVIINGHDATVKRVLKKDNGIMLQPTNHSHEPLFFTQEEIRTLPVVVVGRVVELRAKF